MLVFSIDYKDHYSYFDKSISPYNYMRFSQKEWRKYNSSLHYQNRLRHSDYRKMMLDAGFAILEENPAFPTAEQEEALRALPLHDDFRHYDFDDLKILGSTFVLTK